MKQRSELLPVLYVDREIYRIEDEAEREMAEICLKDKLHDYETSSSFKEDTVEEFENWEYEMQLNRALRSVKRRRAVKGIMDSEETANKGV